jgi:aminobenzoyl-glutamate utilization protein B
MTREDVKASCCNWIAVNHETLSAFHRQIWGFAEPAWREYRSADAYVDLLRTHGFDVEVGSGGMPTAFCARWGDSGPTLCTYAEYDAVPGCSQAPVPRRQPRDDLHPFAPGHTDPHSALGVGALAGVLAARYALERHGIRARLIFFGEPAEKTCGSKPVHALKGYYDGLDAVISYHPEFCNTTIWDTQFAPYWSCVFTFLLDEAAQWVEPSLLVWPGEPQASPHAPGALEAVCSMYALAKHAREAMYPHTGTWTMNEFIMTGGQATADTLAPRIGQIQYAWRSPTLGIQEQLYSVLERCARAAAAAAGCSVAVRWVTKTRPGLANHALASLTYANLAKVGPPSYGEEALRFGRQLQRELGINETDNPFVERCQRLETPQEWEASMRGMLPPWQLNFNADDYTDYTWHAPTVRLFTGKPALAAIPDWTHWATHALGGFPPAIDPTWVVAGKTIAASFVDLASDPTALAACRREFEDRTGGGVGGEKWVGPLLSPDFTPPIDLPWPEYVSTARGHEWHLPTPGGFGQPLL